MPPPLHTELPKRSVTEVTAGKDFIFFQGVLGTLPPHHAGTVCALIAPETEFELSWGSHRERARLALISPGVRHCLEFFNATVIAIYFDPHHPAFGGLHDIAPGQCTVQQGWPDRWTSLVNDYQQSCSEPQRTAMRERLLCHALKQWQPGCLKASARRLGPVLARFIESDTLECDMAHIANLAGVSVSRCTHLLKEEFGVGLRRIKQHYRFKLVVAALAKGASFTQAAHSAGFSDSAHFSRAHKDTCGRSPSTLFTQEVRWSTVSPRVPG